MPVSSPLPPDKGRQGREQCRPLLRCPVCAQALQRADSAFRCPSGHNFDIARQGYVNLWLGDGGKRKVAGDEREMLAARRRFLDTGYYRPLAAAVNRCVQQYGSRDPASGGPLSVVDVGCGEGYYLGQLAEHVQQEGEREAACLYGMDLSKEAARMAAGRYKQAQFFVADVNRRLLVADDAVDVLLNIFAPRNPPEFRRVLAPGGLLLVAIPGPDHLKTLRADYSLLDIEEAKEEKVRQAFGAGFRLLARQPLPYERRLDGEALSDLVRMTPNYWHMSDAGPDVLNAGGERVVHFSFVLLVFTLDEPSEDD